jgi:UDP-N-acetylmuramyl pentapeptide phosphotransferase/UDP-N-acetylglucosamine-1-phosphate transferase
MKKPRQKTFQITSATSQRQFDDKGFNWPRKKISVRIWIFSVACVIVTVHLVAVVLTNRSLRPVRMEVIHEL